MISQTRKNWVEYCDSVATKGRKETQIRLACQLGFNSERSEQRAHTEARRWAEKIGPKTVDLCDQRMADLFLGQHKKTADDFGWIKFCAASRGVSSVPTSQSEINALYDVWAGAQLQANQYPDWPHRAFHNALRKACNDHAEQVGAIWAVAQLTRIDKSRKEWVGAEKLAQDLYKLICEDLWRRLRVGQFVMTKQRWDAYEFVLSVTPILEQKIDHILPKISAKGDSKLRRSLIKNFSNVGELVLCTSQHLERKVGYLKAEIEVIQRLLERVGLQIGMSSEDERVRLYLERKREALQGQDEFATPGVYLSRIRK